MEEQIRKAAKEGSITCSALRRIAEETGVSYELAGTVTDDLKIKIKSCELGCF